MFLFHGFDHVAHCFGITPVSLKHLMGNREPIRRHHQANANLLAIEAGISGVSAGRLGIPFCFPFKGGAGQIVNQNFKFRFEQFPGPMPRMFFDRFLVGIQTIQTRIKRVRVDLVQELTKQIIQSGFAVTVFFNSPRWELTL